MNPWDVVAHAAVTVTLLVTVAVLGATHVISADAVTGALMSSGGTVAVLTIADRRSYGPRRRR